MGLDLAARSGGIPAVTDRRREPGVGRPMVGGVTARGGEGMVVKPFDFVARDRRGLVQPALKTRGPEYLRIIYGPEYDLPENLQQPELHSCAACRPSARWRCVRSHSA